MGTARPPLPGFRAVPGPVVLCVMDGIGIGRPDDGNAVHVARTPVLDRLLATRPHVALAAHGRAVGMPSDSDMGNSEVGHNALGAGRIFQQGASLVNAALAGGQAFGPTWRWLGSSGTLHLLGLLSDGNVHSHVDHLYALVDRAARDGLRRLRVHVLTDGRDVGERTASRWVEPLEARLAKLSAGGLDYRIASGGGRMRIVMDRYEADWEIVRRGWMTVVHGAGRRFPSASQAIQSLYREDPSVTDQYLPAFVVAGEDGEPLGRVEDGDGVLFFNFRGDRAIEISRAFEGRRVPFDRTGPGGRPVPELRFAGMMEYDGDTHVPRRFLVDPPAIDRTVGELLVAAGQSCFAIAETQKFGHVTYFFNGNRSGLIDPALERYVEIPSREPPFELCPAMMAPEVASRAAQEIRSGRWRHLRLNLANGDMVGHTGDFRATVEAVEVVDRCVGLLERAVLDAEGVMLVLADHGNADQMYEIDPTTGEYRRGPGGQRVVRTAHTLDPVPCVLVDSASGRWRSTRLPRPGLANAGTTLLVLAGLVPPGDYLPPLWVPA